jgi:hypothetical protein
MRGVLGVEVQSILIGGCSGMGFLSVGLVNWCQCQREERTYGNDSDDHSSLPRFRRNLVGRVIKIEGSDNPTTDSTVREI